MIPTKEQLIKFAEELNQTAEREVIRISITLAEHLSLTDSKFGGLPYIPAGGSIPTTPEGDLLFMLAQINCEQLPENSIYPKKGLLQFWIAQSIYDNYSDFSHVVYHPTFSEGMEEKDIREIYVLEDCHLPFEPEHQFALSFTKTKEGVSTADNFFDEVYADKWKKDFPDDEIMDYFKMPDNIYEEVLNDGSGHKIGGYPAFAQDDPREEGTYTELLLQIDSDWNDEEKEYSIIWGDVGVGNFFISKENLEKLNFEDVLYNWDCG